MQRGPQEICSEQTEIPLFGSLPSRPAIHTSTAYLCESPREADERLGGKRPGYVYQRDGHPNAAALAEKCRRLHGENSSHAVVTSSGMSAISLAMISQLSTGDHILLSHRLYGRTAILVEQELSRFGIEFSFADFCNLDQVSEQCRPNTRMLVVETISNPKLRVVDFGALAEIAKSRNALILVDNTFASPIVCRPFDFGADLVVESLTKIMNGHGDTTLGLLSGTEAVWERVPAALSSWGMTSGPFDCWLAERGVSTLFLRMSSAANTAKILAERLSSHPQILDVAFPGLQSHPDRAIAVRQFSSLNGETCFGNMITIEVNGGIEGATRFIEATKEIPFCPSLGELMTTLSHPFTTSHRNLNSSQLAKLGISGGTIRFSIGLESADFIESAIATALSGLPNPV